MKLLIFRFRNICAFAVMAGYFVNGGEIPLRYFDRQTYQRTFGVKAYGVALRDVFMALCEILQPEEVVDICKVDSNTFNFSVKDDQAAEILSTVGRIRVKDRVFPLISISKQTVEFRVHWLPSYIKDSFVEDFFSHYGKVTSVTRDAAIFSPNDTKRTGVRRVMMETDELRKRTIPYVITFNGGYSALVTMAGRPPLCLRCRQVGHVRKDCVPVDASQASSQKSYAQAAQKSQPPQATGNDTVESTDNSQSQGDEQAASQEQNQDVSGEVQGQDLSDSLNSTGSTIPPNGPKRGLDQDVDDDDDDDSHGDNLMIDDDREGGYITMGHGGKKVKK